MLSSASQKEAWLRDGAAAGSFSLPCRKAEQRDGGPEGASGAFWELEGAAHLPVGAPHLPAHTPPSLETLLARVQWCQEVVPHGEGRGPLDGHTELGWAGPLPTKKKGQVLEKPWLLWVIGYFFLIYSQKI